MAILRSSDGKFYEVADEQLEGALIPAEQIKEKLGAAGVGPAEGPIGPSPIQGMPVPGTNGQVVIQIHTGGAPMGGYEGGYEEGPEGEAEGDVEAHGWCWRRNYFNNCWRRNCWRNHCRY